jgi:hypothetical protein
MMVDADFENQGVLGKGSISAQAPNLTATDMTFTAQGDVVLRVTDMKWNVDIPDSAFKKPVKSGSPR